MLSNDLRALKIWFDQRLLDGCEMTAEGALAFSRELDAAIGKAEAMETGGVPADALKPRRLTKAQLADPKIVLLPVLARAPAPDAA